MKLTAGWRMIAVMSASSSPNEIMPTASCSSTSRSKAASAGSACPRSAAICEMLLPTQGLVGFAGHRRDEDLFPAHGLREVFPVHARVEVMLDGAALLAQGRSRPSHAPAVVPRRDDHMQERAPRRIGVLGHRDVDPGGAGLVDAPDERGGAAPVLFPADLEVGDHGGDAGAFADGDHLFHGFGDGVGLVAHVHVVDAAVRRRGLWLRLPFPQGSGSGSEGRSARRRCRARPRPCTGRPDPAWPGFRGLPRACRSCP